MGNVVRGVAGTAVLAIGLAACGGGGGGSGGSSGSDQKGGDGGAGYTTVNASIASVTPTSIQADDYESDVAPGHTLFYGTAGGDLGVLNGKTLYVILEDPDSLYQPNPTVFVSGASLSLTAINQVKKAGRYKGALSVYACLDAGCTVRLGNVPFKIPYDVVVRRNAVFDATGDYAVVAAVPFSGAARTLAFKVRPPEATAVSALQFSPGYSSVGIQGSFADNGDGSGTISVQVPPSTLPGHYTLDYRFQTRVGTPYVPSKVLKVELDVIPDPALPYTFTQSPAHFSARLADGTYYQSGGVAVALAQQGGTLSLQGAEILYTDEQAAAVPSVRQSWFIGASEASYRPDPRIFPTSVSFTGCVRDDGITTCLPAGSYAFRLRYAYTLNGSTSAVNYDGAFTITP